jgi:manganese/iron transport system substrate-binding protein
MACNLKEQGYSLQDISKEFYVAQRRHDMRTFKIRSCSALFLALIFVSGFAKADSEKFKIVTSFTIIADMARQVAGEAATVESITRPGAEIHEYQPTPRDLVRAQGADLILWNGMNLERWFERFLQDIKDVESVVVTEGITPLSIYEGPYTGKPNPHAWMSPENALIYIENIRKALALHDPENAAIYDQNAAAYRAEILALASALKDRFAKIPETQRWLATSEGAFSYLARDFDFQELYLWPINADQQGTPQQVRKVIDTIRARDIPVVFSESTVSDKPARQVAAETGALYGGVLYVDSLSEEGGPVPSYLDLLRVTTETIAKGFEAAEAQP